MVLINTMAKPEETAANNLNSFDSSDDENATYDETPFKIDWLDLSKYECADLGISGLPGCRFKDTWRKLERDIEAIKREQVDDVFVLCTRGELHKYRVPSLIQHLKDGDLTVHQFPFPDGSSPSFEDAIKMLDALQANLKQSRKCLVHCYGGLGRSGLVAVSLLMILDEDLDAEAAIEKIRELKGPGAIQSVKQYNFIQEFREKLQEHHSSKSEEETSRSVSR